MAEIRFDGDAFGKLAKLISESNPDPSTRKRLAKRCKEQLDALGKGADEFIGGVTDPALVNTLQKAIQKARNQELKFRKPIRLYELVREMRGRYSRCEKNTHSIADKAAIVGFGDVVEPIQMHAAA